MKAPRSLQLARLAGRALGAKLRKEPAAHDAALARVVGHLGRMHGLPQKIGQILASAELDGDARHFAPLTENVAFALPPAEARAVIAQRLGRPLDAVFAELDEHGIAASFGQVHRATLRDGRRVAVKLSYPRVGETLRADLRALGWLAAPLGNLRRDFDLPAYRRELGVRLAAELDYAAEADALRRFRRHTAGWSGVAIPAPLDEFCRPDLLVMDWLDGADLGAAVRWPPAERAALAETLLRVFLAGVFRWGELHGDPHPGNYRYFRTDAVGPARVGWLDFGSIHPVPAAFAAALRALIAARRRGPLDADDAWAFHERAGFATAALGPLRETLPRVLEPLLRPFATAGGFDVANWHPGDELPALLGERRIAYRVAGPPALMFFIRAFHGLLAQLRALAVPLDWNRALDEATATAAPFVPLIPAAAVPRPRATTALFVQVLDGGEQRVRIEFDGDAAERLEELIPEDLLPGIRARGIDVRALSARAVATHFAPQDLFTYDQGTRRIRVWLA